MRKSRNKVFVRGFSHENLMRLSWAFNAREKNEILTSKKAHEKISWECHFLMRISWESHEILMSFQFSWEKWDSHEQKTSWEILLRIGKFSWECHFLMRISWDSHENSKTHENFCKGSTTSQNCTTLTGQGIIISYVRNTFPNVIGLIWLQPLPQIWVWRTTFT